MAFCPEIAESEIEAHPRRRSSPRQNLRSLAYVKLDQANGGIIRDLTDSGVAIQAVGALHPNQEVNVRFDLLSPRVRVETRGRVAWSDRSGQAGIQFLDLPLRVRRSLRDWLLVQMLASAVVSGRDSMFASAVCDELTFSPVAQAPILMEPTPLVADSSPLPCVAWGWFTLSARNFGIFVDGLVLACAVLLFSVSSVVVMGGTPAWPLAVALLFTTSTIFLAIYQILFSDFLCGATPGARLARLAVSGPLQENQDQRFR